VPCVDAGFVSVDASLGSAEDLTAFVPVAFVPDAAIQYPAIAPDAGTALLAGEQSARSSIWFATPVPLAAFDVRFELLVTCSSQDCADGLAFVWLDTSSVDAAFGVEADQGSSFGIPWRVGGAAVAVDLFQNTSPMNDPLTPALELLALDPASTPTAFPWVVGSAPAPALRSGAWTEMAISVRGAQVSVQYGPTVAKAGLPPVARGVFGITGATGTSAAGFNVRNLRGSFASCPPSAPNP
jgi:hypothetical protein